MQIAKADFWGSNHLRLGKKLFFCIYVFFQLNSMPIDVKLDTKLIYTDICAVLWEIFRKKITEFIFFNHKFCLLFTLTYMKGSEFVWFLVFRRMILSFIGYRLTRATKEPCSKLKMRKVRQEPYLFQINQPKEIIKSIIVDTFFLYFL